MTKYKVMQQQKIYRFVLPATKTINGELLPDNFERTYRIPQDKPTIDRARVDFLMAYFYQRQGLTSQNPNFAFKFKKNFDKYKKRVSIRDITPLPPITPPTPVKSKPKPGEQLSLFPEDNMNKKLNQILMLEAKCPTCGKEGAYIGFNTVECPNQACRHYKGGINYSKYFQEALDENPDIDTRYEEAVAELYARVISKIMGDDWHNCKAAADEFLIQTEKYHEQNRHNFKPHPDFLEKIMEISHDLT